MPLRDEGGQGFHFYTFFRMRSPARFRAVA